MDKKTLGLYAKAVGGAVIAGLSAVVAALADGHIDPLEWATVAGAVLVGLGAVWVIPEFPVSVGKYLKAITSGLVSGLASFSAIAINGHLPTQQEWITIAVAVAIGSGLVHVTKNAAASQTMHGVTSVSTTKPTPKNVVVAPDENDAIEEEVPEEVVPVEEDFVVDTTDDPDTAKNQVEVK